MMGAVGVPMYETFEYKTLFWENVGIEGGVAPARRYIPELLGTSPSGRINSGLVFDFTTDLRHVADAYAAVEERRTIKSLLTVSLPSLVRPADAPDTRPQVDPAPRPIRSDLRCPGRVVRSRCEQRVADARAHA
jgi:hypothetical protein